MEESEDNMNTEDVTNMGSPSAVRKPKKRSLVERELETSLTCRVTSPAIIADGLSTSRYGRARRLKIHRDLIESQKLLMASNKPLENENTPVKVVSPVYRMHASNSPLKSETPIKLEETYLDNQIDNIYQENISLSRFSNEPGSPSSAKKIPKVYIRKDLLQKREAEETIMLIKNLFSPTKSSTKSSYGSSSANLEFSSEKIISKQNGHVDNTSVVKALDFDSNKKVKKDSKDQKLMSKNELFELEAKCPYQVGDLAWARMGTFPFWPCIITRDPYSEMFVKKKLFGRVEHDILHVTFFGDNGRRSWIVDNMLRNYLGQLEFEATRAKFTLEDKKKDPRLYAAYFVSDKKQALWNTSVEEAESLLRHPKRLRVDIFNEMLLKFRASKKHQKSGKITRTDSDVSLSESLYDSLFSEEELKTDDAERSKNRSRNKSFDVSDVVTACLDNMAAKTGITKIQRQSHMDRWLQKAKSKTPEKNQMKGTAGSLNTENPEKQVVPPVVSKLHTKVSGKSKKPPTILSVKPYQLRKGNEFQSKVAQIAPDESKIGSNDDVIIVDDISNNIHENSATIIIDDTSDTDMVSNSNSNPSIDNTTKPVQAELSETTKEVKQDILAIISDNDKNFDYAKVHSLASKSKKKLTPPPGKQYKLRKMSEALTKSTQNDVEINRSKGDSIMIENISNNFNVDVEIEPLSDTDNEEPLTLMSVDYTSSAVTEPKDELGIESTTDLFHPNSKQSDSVVEVNEDTIKLPAESDKKSDDTTHPVKVPNLASKSKKASTTPQLKRYRLRRSSEAQTKLTYNVVEKNCSRSDVIIVDDISNNFNVDVEIEPLSDKDKYINEEQLTISANHTSNTFTKPKGELDIDSITKPVQTSKSKKKPSTTPPVKRYRLRRSSESQSKLTQCDVGENSSKGDIITIDEISNNFNVDVEIESLSHKDTEVSSTEMSVDDTSDTVTKAKDDPDLDNTTKPVQDNSELSDNVAEVKQNTTKTPTESDKHSEDTINSVRVPTLGKKSPSTIPSVKRYRLRRTGESQSKLTQYDEGKNRSKSDIVMVDDISNDIDVDAKVESLSVTDINVDPSTIMSVDDTTDTVLKPKDEPNTDNTTQPLQANREIESVKEVKEGNPIMIAHKDKMSDNIVHLKTEPCISSQNKDVPSIIPSVNRYRLRRSGESQCKLIPHDKSKNRTKDDIIVVDITNNIHVDSKVEALADDTAIITSVDGTLNSDTKPKHELGIVAATSPDHINSGEEIKQNALMPIDENDINSKDMHQKSEPSLASESKKKTPAIHVVKRYRLRRSESQSKLAQPDETNKISKDDITMVDNILDKVDGKVEDQVHKSKGRHDDTLTITPVVDTSDSFTKLNQHELVVDNSNTLVQDNISEAVKPDIFTLPADNHKISNEQKPPCIPSVKLFRLRRTKSKLTQDETKSLIENLKLIEGISNTLHANDNKTESLTKSIIEDANLDTSTKLSYNEEIPACIVNPKENPSKENSGISNSHKTRFDSVDMEVDQGTNNLQEDVQGYRKQNDSSIAAMEVDDENVDKEETECIKFQTVSNECVKDNTLQSIYNHSNIKSAIPGLQEAQNVTIEASVTETKNDDILTNQEEGRQQGSNKLETSINTETKLNNIDFLDVINGHKVNLVDKTQETLGPKIYSTPEKIVNNDIIEANENFNCILTNKLNFEEISLNRGKIKDQNDISSDKISKMQENDFCETDIIKIPNEIVDQKDDPTKIVANKSTIGQHVNDEEMSVGGDNDVLNMSGNSESILQDNNEIDNLPVESSQISSESVFNTSFNESNASESILDCIQASVNSTEKSINKLDDATKSNFIFDENHESTTRQYVESPTFTQLLESEEFFRDVNETYESGNNHESKSHDKYSKECAMKDVAENEVQAAHQNENNTQNVGAGYEDEEDTSEDEPSPEYESLDEDITEDFRKHMMSIESNITDKKDEQQIVKICNEIAEKAKLSPTKNTIDLPMAKTKDKHEKNPEDKIDDIKQKDMLIISPKRILDLHLKENLGMSIENNKTEILKRIPTEEDELFATTENKHTEVHNESGPKIAGDPSLNDVCDKTEVCKDYSLKINDDVTLKNGDPSLNVCDKTEVNKDNSLKINIDGTLQKKSDETKIINRTCYKDNSLKINVDGTLQKKSDVTKIMNRTCLAINSVTKERASPDFIIKSSEIEELRKSCEYDPKVVIIPLERDATGLLKVVKNKYREQEKSKTKSNKYRLTLKRENTPTKLTVNNAILALSAPNAKLEESEDQPPESIVKEEEMVNSNKVPKKMIIENGAIETNIPGPLKEMAGHTMNRKQTETPDLIDDTEFDIDAVSVNSEDSEISLPNSVRCVPRRNLRSRSERTLEYALKNPEFLKYLELRQDYLMELHPDLDQDEVVIYVYKTWQYEEDLKSDIKKIEDARNSSLIKDPKHETPSRKRSKKGQPKDNLQNNLREKYENCKNTNEVVSETRLVTSDSPEVDRPKMRSISPVDSGIEQRSKDKTEEVSGKRKTKSPNKVDLTSEPSNDVILVKDKDLDSVSVKSEESLTPKRTLRSKVITSKNYEKEIKVDKKMSALGAKVKEKTEFDTESIDSEDSEVTLRELKSKFLKESELNGFKTESTTETRLDAIAETKEQDQKTTIKEEDVETASTVSDNEPLLKQKKKPDKKSIEHPEFIEYMELRQDALMDENPQLTQEEIVGYLYKTWLYQESSKSDLKKNDVLEKVNLVKGLNDNEAAPPKKVRRRPKVEKAIDEVVLSKEKPKRRIIQPYYNENFSDIEDELEIFEIFKTKEAPITIVSKTDTDKEKDKSPSIKTEQGEMPEFAPKIKEVYETKDVKPVLVNEEGEKLNDEEVEYVDEIELYFADLTKPRPNVFKGLIREKVCDICMVPGNLVKCKGCNGMFHPDCVKRETESVEKDDSLLLRGRKKKKKQGRKPKSLEDSGSHSDEKSQDVSADMSVDDIVVPPEISTFDAESFETQLAAKMKELIDPTETNYDYYSSDDGTDWKESVAGKCEIVDVKLKLKSPPIDYSDFRCNNCQKYDVPVCFVCMAAVSKTNVKMRQKCHVAHCNMYYHLECLDHWPQTQFNAGEPSRSNKKINEFFEPLTCPRHVCHTCVSDDPRGCKTRFCGDKLARCVRCPATYHSFNKCLPAGSQILTASHILCPRHCDDRTAKVPCHVNTGWCFICALGGSLICCEYCPTSFHAECLNIKPPEGNYMCEDCETGRLPLYGEMVWVKLGHYRWWPGIILHPSEIPENIMAVKHSLGEFVVRFFGQYDHYWVNRGRVFPYQEGDTGRISGQKSKIDADFTLAIEHAQRAYTILKNAEPNEEESLDIASSLLPPHYVKLKCNKPCGSLCGRKVEDPSLSLTQCECNPGEPDPCGLYSQCLNRMLLTECGPTCRAGERCNNRAFEKRLYPKLVPYRTPHRGWGLKTLEHIRAGQFVIEYVGELIDESEFKRRMRRKHEIRDENFYFLTLDKERMIDAGPKGNAARFMNHCCEPNCETQKWTVLGDVRVGLFAINDIPANSEVTFNYNLECTGIEKKRCLCGAKRCSGYIGAKPKQEESHSKKGKDGKITGKRTYNKKKKVSNQEESPSTKNKPKRPLGRPPKPKELTEIEKDLLIIKSATNISSGESSRRQSLEDKNPKSLKRKRLSISTDEVSLCNGQEPSVKKQKCEEKTVEVGD